MTDIVTELRALCAELDQALAAGSPGDAASPQPYPPPADLTASVPFRSQWDEDGNEHKSDCGPACVAMVLQFYSIWADINQLAAEAGMTSVRRFTVPGDLIRAAMLHGVTLVRKVGCDIEMLSAEVAAGRPVIVLIHYGSLDTLRQDRSYGNGHWVVVVGVDESSVRIHDPDWRALNRSQGRGLVVPRPVFAEAWSECVVDGNTPHQCLMVVPKVSL